MIVILYEWEVVLMSMPPLPTKEPFEPWIKWSAAGFCITAGLSTILGLSIESMDFGSAVGTTLQFIFWLGIGAFFQSFNSYETEWKLFRYGGLLAILSPIVLVCFIAIGGILSYIAFAISMLLCLWLGYGMRDDT